MGMESLTELYRIGMGPSSSHTMGPRKAAQIFFQKNAKSKNFKITFFGSLAATGKGHLTDIAIYSVLGKDKTEIIWKPDDFLPEHPNGMLFESFSPTDSWEVYSIGGGALQDKNRTIILNEIYNSSSMNEILNWTEKNGTTFWEYVNQCESPEIWMHLEEVWKTMKKAISRGLESEGVLPGILKLPRKASSYYAKAKTSNGFLQKYSFVFAFALAVAEENAAGGIIVTAPTCGSAGILPSVLKLIQTAYKISDKKIIYSLATAGIIGNLIKANASISGADVGCQGEVGSACAMAAAAAAELLGGTTFQIEYAAEMGLEHHLGLTCDPVAGLVQIPCIERNAMAAARAVECAAYALNSDGKHRISFDKVVETMEQTGHDLKRRYKETSTGGLAKFF
jgi:L-serine dehydratase